MKFEAQDENWRLVPEFKYLTARLIPETSTVVAALKTKEIDLSQVPAAQLADLKAAGVAVEASSLGGNIIFAGLGGMIIAADKRYDANNHNKDPWTNPQVRKAMALAIDRQSLVKAVYAGYAEPVGVPIYTPDMGKFQYPYDPAAARQLLKDAGYPYGFSFRVISYAMQGLPEMPQIAEALAGFWQGIGLDPKITVIDYNTYNNKNILTCKTAGDTYLLGLTVVADQMSRIEMSMMPGGISIGFEDEGSYAIYQNNPHMTFEERNSLVDKINQYYFEKVGPIPLVRIGYCYGWNSEKVSAWAHSESPKPIYLEYIRHAQPLNTFRLFTPVPGR
jgi:ABC-type transport system substrate-binding protein